MHSAKSSSNKVGKHITHFGSKAAHNTKMCCPFASLHRPATWGPPPSEPAMRQPRGCSRPTSRGIPPRHPRSAAAARRRDLRGVAVAHAQPGSPTTLPLPPAWRAESAAPARGEPGLRRGQRLRDIFPTARSGHEEDGEAQKEEGWLRPRRRRRRGGGGAWRKSRGGGGAWRKSRGGRMRREGAGVAGRFVFSCSVGER